MNLRLPRILMAIIFSCSILETQLIALVFGLASVCFTLKIAGRNDSGSMVYLVLAGTIASSLFNAIGETTLLKCMIGLLPWQSGQSLLCGRDIHTMKPKDVWSTISYIPQTHGFAFSYTGLEMVMLGRSAHLGTFQQPGKHEIELAEAMMEKVGISAMMNTHYPTNAMSVADEAFLMNHSGEFFYGPARDVLNGQNISRSFDVQVVVDEFAYAGRTVRSIVPVALRGAAV